MNNPLNNPNNLSNNPSNNPGNPEYTNNHDDSYGGVVRTAGNMINQFKLREKLKNGGKEISDDILNLQITEIMSKHDWICGGCDNRYNPNEPDNNPYDSPDSPYSRPDNPYNPIPFLDMWGLR